MSTKTISEGKILTLTAPEGGVTSGVPVKIGTLVVVPQVTADAGASFAAASEGVHSVTKVGSQAWTEGAVVYWDAGDARFTTTAADGYPAGVAVEAVGSGAGETTGKVKLFGAGFFQSAVIAALGGSLTGTVDGDLADIAAIALSTSNTYTDAAVNSAVNTAITSANLQLKELQTKVNALVAALKAAGLMAVA